MSTHLIHHGYTPPSDFSAPQPGVFKASTVFFPNVAAMRQREWKDKSAYTYGTHGTPTTFTLEERLCALEGGRHCVLTPSGLSAISLVSFSVLKTGDHVLIPDNAYGPNKVLAEGELTAFGISHTYYDAMDTEDLRSKIKPNTKLVWLEAPGSLSMEFPDLLELVRTCQHHGILTALDNTWGAGIAFKPFNLTGHHDLAVDFSIHALTKYPSGGGDVLMGSVMSLDDTLGLKMKLTHMRLGLCVGANDAEAVLRSLPTIHLRYAQQDQTARALAHWCRAKRSASKSYTQPCWALQVIPIGRVCAVQKMSLGMLLAYSVCCWTHVFLKLRLMHFVTPWRFLELATAGGANQLGGALSIGKCSKFMAQRVAKRPSGAVFNGL